jgi:hypothetical protein
VSTKKWYSNGAPLVVREETPRRGEGAEGGEEKKNEKERGVARRMWMMRMSDVMASNSLR